MHNINVIKKESNEVDSRRGVESLLRVSPVQQRWIHDAHTMGQWKNHSQVERIS